MKSVFCCGRRAAVILLGVALATPAVAQVSVAPTALFLTEQGRFGAIHISNGSTTAQEVTIGFRFGYPAADSAGNVMMQYDDSVNASRFSIAENVRAFPQRFILPPGETQVVRLTAQAPADAADGLYWARVVTTSTPQVVFDPDTTTSGVQTRVQFRLQQVTALFYRKGAPVVQVRLGDLAAARDSAGIHLAAQLDHSGNSPFFGSARIRVLDIDNHVVHDERQSLALYVSERRRFAIAATDVPPGIYTVELTLSAERSDLPQDQLTPIEPISGRARITIPKGS